MERFDLAVIGLGPIGAGALRHAASAGVRCIGVGSPEPSDHAAHDGPFASHYDAGRVTRHVDATFEWAELARRSIADYPAIESASGIAFHHPVGVIYASADADEIAAVDEVVARLAAQGIVIGRTSDPDVRCDDRLSFPAHAVRFVEGSPAGFVDPRRMIAAQLAAARARGALVRSGVVIAVEPADGGWSIGCSGAEPVHTTRLVLAAGPHVDELAGLPRHLDVDVRAEVVATAVLDASEQSRLEGLPSVLAPVEHPTFVDVYLVPPTRYPDGTVRLKLGATRHRTVAVPGAAARRAWMRGDEHAADLGALRSLTEGLLPGLRADRWETKPCLITDTPSGLPFVDHIDDNFVVAAGCNGYAAKSGDSIGALAARLAIDGRWNDRALDPARFAVT